MLALNHDLYEELAAEDQHSRREGLRLLSGYYNDPQNDDGWDQEYEDRRQQHFNGMADALDAFGDMLQGK